MNVKKYIGRLGMGVTVIATLYTNGFPVDDPWDGSNEQKLEHNLRMYRRAHRKGSCDTKQQARLGDALSNYVDVLHTYMQGEFSEGTPFYEGGLIKKVKSRIEECKKNAPYAFQEKAVR